MGLIQESNITDALAQYLDAGRSGNKVISALEQYMLSQPPDTSRNHRLLHPSEVAADDWCPRYNQMVIEDRVDMRAEVLRLRMRSIFAYGHLAHAKWQGWFRDMGVLWGKWNCSLCGDVSVGAEPDGSGHRYEYREVPLDSGIWGGHADGVLTMDFDTLLLEVKTVGTGTIRYGAPSLLSKGSLEEMFDAITQPFANHMRQAQIYLELFHRQNHPAYSTIKDSLESAVFLYECKSNQAAREFIVKRDDSWVSDRMEQADLLEGYIHSGELIECPHDGSCKCRR